MERNIMNSENFVLGLGMSMFIGSGIMVALAGHPLLGVATTWFGVGLFQIALYIKND